MLHYWKDMTLIGLLLHYSLIAFLTSNIYDIIKSQFLFQKDYDCFSSEYFNCFSFARETRVVAQHVIKVLLYAGNVVHRLNSDPDVIEHNPEIPRYEETRY